MLDKYFEHVKKREEEGVPPLPLDTDTTKEVCKLLENPPSGKEEVGHKDQELQHREERAKPAARLIFSAHNSPENDIGK